MGAGNSRRHELLQTTAFGNCQIQCSHTGFFFIWRAMTRYGSENGVDPQATGQIRR